MKRASYRRNRETVLKKQRAYASKNRQLISQRKKQYRSANRERVLAGKKQWYERNKNAILKKMSAYVRTDKVRTRRNEHFRAKVASLHASYLKHLMRWPWKDIPQKLLQAKAVHLLVKRYLKEQR